MSEKEKRKGLRIFGFVMLYILVALVLIFYCLTGYLYFTYKDAPDDAFLFGWRMYVSDGSADGLGRGNVYMIKHIEDIDTLAGSDYVFYIQDGLLTGGLVTEVADGGEILLYGSEKSVPKEELRGKVTYRVDFLSLFGMLYVKYSFIKYIYFFFPAGLLVLILIITLAAALISKNKAKKRAFEIDDDINTPVPFYENTPVGEMQDLEDNIEAGKGNPDDTGSNDSLVNIWDAIKK